MKRIIYTIIFIATQIGCMAQVNPKVEGLYAYLKAKNLINSCDIKKEISGEMYKRFECEFLVCENDFPVVDPFGNQMDIEGSDSIKRLRLADKREAFKMIRRTILDLTDDAAESYSYEYHQNGNDTIITSMALKRDYKYNVTSNIDSNNRKHVSTAHEMINFTYTNYDLGFGKEVGRSYLLTLKYSGIIERNYGHASFDIKTLQNQIAPLINDKKIKRHTFTCNVDSTYKNHTNFYYCEYWKDIWGKNNTTVLKFTDEKRAKEFLHQLMECVRKNIESNHHQAYSICPDEQFSVDGYPTPIFVGRQTAKYSNPNDYKSDIVENEKRLIIQTHSDMQGFYILISNIEGCIYHPMEWKSLKEFNNGKKTYYKDKL